MLGISVYFQDLDYTYIKECAKIGVNYLFTSLHIPEEDYSQLDQQLPQFLSICQDYGMEIVPDVSPVTFEKLKIPYGDFQALKVLGFHTLRLDYGFDDIEYIKNLAHDFTLMLNASVIDENVIQNMRDAKLNIQDIIVVHNFYPKTYTGLSEEQFITKNQLFQKYNMKVQAFVCGDKQKRFPLYEGLPTLERHRDMNPYIATIEMIQKYHIQDIFIGDSQVKLETLQMMKDYVDHRILTLKVFLEGPYHYLYNQTIKCRKDHSDYAIRVNTPRVAHVDIFQNTIRRKGSITIDNCLMGRYCGEVQLVMEDLPRDARVNVIGFIHPDFIDALKYIDENTTIQFIKL